MLMKIMSLREKAKRKLLDAVLSAEVKEAVYMKINPVQINKVKARRVVTRN